jgi:hypothetical protein
MTYSFLDVQATITGPGGLISLGSGSGAAEEGISFEPSEDTDTMLIGADGKTVHSLHASKAGKIRVRLLKTSPVNGQLQLMYNFQRISSANHGRNVMLITDIARGDVYTCRGVAFSRLPANTYSKEAGTMEWEFNASQIDPLLGQSESLAL